MDSSNANIRNAGRTRASRKHALGAESLEGRQLLSTTAGAAAPPAQAVATTPTAGTAMSGHGYNFGGGHSFGRMERMARLGGDSGFSPASSLAGGAAGSQTSGSAVGNGGVSSSSPMAGYPGSNGGFSFSGRGHRGYAGSMMAGGGSGFGGGTFGGGTFGGSGGTFGGSGWNVGGSGLGDRSGYGSVLKADSPAVATTATTLTPQERLTAINQLQADEQAILDKSNVTPALKAAVRNDLTAVRKDVTATPDLAKLQALQTDLQAVAGTLPTASQLAQIQSDYAAVLASEGVADPAVINQAFADAQKVVAATNITADDLTKVAADRQAAGLPSGLGGGQASRNIDLGSLLGVGSLTHRSIRFNAPMMAPTAAVATTTTAATTATS